MQNCPESPFFCIKKVEIVLYLFEKWRKKKDSMSGDSRDHTPDFSIKFGSMVPILSIYIRCKKECDLP